MNTVTPDEVSHLPQTDEDRLKFRNFLANRLNEIELPEDVILLLKDFMTMHNLEMMTRLSFENSLKNRNLVLKGFQSEFPDVKKDQIKSIDEALEAFAKVRNTIIEMNVLATEHFNRCSNLLEAIEKISKDHSKTEEERVAEGQALMVDLIALHKGADGEHRRHY